MTLHQLLNPGSIPTPYTDRFSQLARDIREADALEAEEDAARLARLEHAREMRAMDDYWAAVASGDE